MHGKLNLGMKRLGIRIAYAWIPIDICNFFALVLLIPRKDTKRISTCKPQRRSASKCFEIAEYSYKCSRV